MAFFQATQVVNKTPVISADGIENITVVGDFTTVAGMVTGEMIEMVALPAGYVPIDLIVAVDGSAGAAFTTDCGILSGDYGSTAARTMGNEAFAANTVGQGAAGLARAVKPNLAQLAPATNDRGIGLKIVGTLTSLVVGTKIRVSLVCRAARNGA